MCWLKCQRLALFGSLLINVTFPAKLGNTSRGLMSYCCLPFSAAFNLFVPALNSKFTQWTWLAQPPLPNSLSIFQEDLSLFFSPHFLFIRLLFQADEWMMRLDRSILLAESDREVGSCFWVFFPWRRRAAKQLLRTFNHKLLSDQVVMWASIHHPFIIYASFH